MTDRDHFAAAALTGLLANDGDGPALSKQCEYAYCIADAMLRERERVTEPTNRDTTAPATKSERVNLATANEFHAEIARLHGLLDRLKP